MKKTNKMKTTKKKATALAMTMALTLLFTGCGMSTGSGDTAKDGKPREDVYETGDVYSEPAMEAAAAPSAMADGSYGYKYSDSYEPGYLEEEETDWNTEEYNYTEENGFLLSRSAPFSTFAADVDTASYANLRRQLRRAEGVSPDSVRIEELINYFSYDYPEPEGRDPFSVTTKLADTPWNPDTKLMLIGLQAKKADFSELPRSNLVFLIDVSGSMDEGNKLPLVQRSFLTLVDNLHPKDKVSIVTYSSGEEVIIDGKDGDSKNEIMAAIESLYAAGSTNGESALQMAYRIAEKHFIEGGNNRIIMATDGDFNVGITSEGDLTRIIKDKAKNGVYLSVLGFGMGNYKDNKLEALADNGNGNYAYIDDVSEARKVLVEEIGGTLFTVAKDVKLQVEFNPAEVKGYRLIGYENRKMAAEDFADDTKDGGELGAGHSVTALYELVLKDSAYELDNVPSKYGNDTAPAGASDELLTVNIRYKAPDSRTSDLIEVPVGMDSYTGKMDDNMLWAAGVAQCGMLIRESPYAGSSRFADIRKALEKAATDDYRREFTELIREMEDQFDDTYDREYLDSGTVTASFL